MIVNFSKWISAFALLSLSATTLVNASTARVNGDIDANYDDIPINALTGGSVPSPYKGLDYDQSFIVVSSADTLAPPALPHSPPQTVIFTQLLPDFETISIITTTDSQLMDLSGFYFACAINDANSVAPVGTNCDILVTGFSGEEQVAQQTFSYTFRGDGSAMQEVAGLGKSGFTGLDELTFQIVDTGLPPDLYAVSLDDLTYELNSAQ
ncbi:hypothetical protein GYMLUDRAFT_82125 [Collybiopsis luxurians FD-317 M1]|nr:hypothetical protein GYMLUDRAFT_82125 [Collybiopsis luxurians FD-317 M1]